MDTLFDAAVIWFLIGFVLFVLEFALPGFILFFFGIGAWIVAILTFFFDISFNTQLIIFLFSSVITLLLFRKSLHRIMTSRRHTSEIEDEIVGKTGRAETDIRPGKDGKVNFKGTTWNARSEDHIAEGEIVHITGNDSILLFVKSTKPIL